MAKGIAMIMRQWKRSSTRKADLIWRDTWETHRQAEMAIFEDNNGFYNPRRRHSALGCKSPVAFERKVLNRLLGAALKRDRSRTGPKSTDISINKTHVYSPAVAGKQTVSKNMLSY